MRLSDHFSLSEFTRSRTAAKLGISNEPTPEHAAKLMLLCEQILEPLRDEVGVPITISSGYRSSALNEAIHGSRRSQHCRGEAADIIVPGLAPLEVCKLIEAMGLPFDQLIHEFGQWTHVSYHEPARGETLTARHTDGGVQYIKGLWSV